ncbi:hypothetical protein [Alcaligenes endophyticus]|uniref:FtsK gamma domain-containing protein n=1 Tax=Alcaligenes endophyticus TaxID=1929088 RepID=A0ABT8ENL0_9BURK|nr:hypothetical protein [Alcaligenes endophyticus]MCX5592841.1 hypothetical protein [Alcaligenes endophyticus]MDN4122868.1 hypothetical protein [Alcaligenes endophyticus]
MTDTRRLLSDADVKQIIPPYGYRLVRLADIDTAIQRASVFDDGGDGADSESARSCIEILRSMLSGALIAGAESAEPVNETFAIEVPKESPAQPYSLRDDPAGIRALTADAITGALVSGYQNISPPPDSNHWLAPFWKIGRESGDKVDTDPLQGAANWLVRDCGVRYISELSRRLSIGYNRASRLIDAARKEQK